MDTIEERLTKVESDMDAIKATLAEITVLHQETDQLLKNFIYESNRVRTNIAEKADKNEDRISSLIQLVQASYRRGEENKADIAALTQVVQTTAENIDRLELQQQATAANVDKVVQAVEAQGVRLDTLINRIVTNPDEN